MPILPLQPTRLASLLRWDIAETPAVLRNRDGALMACLRVRGPDLYSALGSELVVQADQLNSLWRRLGGTWTLQTEARRQSVCRYPEATWPDPVSQLIDEEREADFLTPGTHWETVTTLTLTWKGARQQRSGLKRVFYANLPEQEGHDDVPRFAEEMRRIIGLLGECCEEVEQLTENTLLTYLHSTISWKDQEIDWPEVPAYLGHYLADTDLERVWELPSVIRWPKLGTQYVRCVGVKRYPKQGHPGMFEVLDELTIPHRACLRWKPLSQPAATQEAKRYGGAYRGQRKEGTGVNLAADSLAMQAARFQQGVEEHEWSGGYPTQTIVVWGETFADATWRAEQIDQALSSVGCVAKIETVNTMSAWLGTLPGETMRNARKPLLHSKNLAHMGPWQSTTRGARENRHLQGPPMLTVTGRGQSVCGLDTYEDDLGHFFIIGPPGAGKSFLFALLGLQARKYQGDLYIFDKDQSMRCPTYAVGGLWHDLHGVLQTLALGGETLEEIMQHAWGIGWELPPGRWHCFETDGLAQTPEIIPQLMEPICRAIEGRMQGQHVGIFFDEFWRFLKLQFFEEKAQDWLLTMRKKNGFVGFSTQNIAHITQSAIGSDIFQACPTRFYLANRHAIEPATQRLYLDLGLNEREVAIIAQLTPKKTYFCQGPHGNFVFELTAGPIQRALAGASRKADLALMAAIYAKDPQHFAHNWLMARNLPDAAARLEELICGTNDC